MEQLNIPQTLFALLKATMNNNRCSFKIQNRLSEPTNVKNGIRQADSLACLICNIALQIVVRDVALNARGTIFSKSVQTVAHAVDIDK
jgi:hypothetical protein